MQVNRGLVFWGVALVTAGVVALAIQSGAIAEETARDAWRLWPVALIIIGLAVIAARTPFALVVVLIAGLAVGGLGGTLAAGWPAGLSIGCGGEPAESSGETGSFDGAADVVIDFNCGDLAVSTAEGSDWSAELRHGSGSEPDVASDGDSLTLRTRGGGFFTESRQLWDVTLPIGEELALTVGTNAASSDLDLADADLGEARFEMNAGDMTIDLTGATVADLAVDSNAGSIAIIAADGTEARGSVELNAGSFSLCAADDLVVAITMEDSNVTFGHNLDDLGLTRQGDTWRTGDGTPDLELTVDGNAASFTMNPDGGCR